MKAERYFLSMIITLLPLLFSQVASAAYMYTYKTPIMTAYEEHTYDEHGYRPGSGDFFWKTEEQFEVKFILPELEYDLDSLEDLESFYTVFENPVVSVSAANFFNTITINSSSFGFETWKYEEYVDQSWWLSFEISDSSFSNDMVRRASVYISSYGSHMTFYQDNYYTKRCAGQYPPEWEMGCWSGTFDSVVEFYGEDTREILDEYPGGIKGLVGEKISVPEPLSPLLLLAGMAGIFFSRRIKLKKV